MYIEFKEEFRAPIGEVYSYFRTPQDWVRLYGISGATKDLGGGWYAVPLKNFPFPLIAKVSESKTDQFVRWDFRGFWRGDGEIRFSTFNGKVTVEGYENISVRCLYFLSPLFEKLFLEQRFKRIWNSGWNRIRKAEGRGRS